MRELAPYSNYTHRHCMYIVQCTHYTCINKYVHVLSRLVYNRFKQVQCENGVQAYICKNHFERGMYSDSCCVGSTVVLSSRKQSQTIVDE